MNGRLEIPEKAKLLRVPAIQHQAKTRLYVVRGDPWAYQTAIHSSCICNELQALSNRHLVETPPVDVRIWRRAAKKMQSQIRVPFMEKMPYMDIVKSYAGAKRRGYYLALQQLYQEGLNDRDSRVQMFIKPDRHPLDIITEKHPRAIQYRSKKFNLAMAAYLKPFEEWFYVQPYGYSETRAVVKGLNPYERAELFMEKVGCYTDPIYIELDHKHFDSTIAVEHLKTTHKIYNKAFRSKQLMRLLRKQLRNVGYTKGGIKYKVDGTRMSGDYDTGLGNSLVNLIALTALMDHYKIKKWDVILDGDDSVIIVEKRQLPVDFSATFLEKIGFRTKFIVKHSINTVDFCQARLMRYPRPNFVRNPLRALAHSCTTVRPPVNGDRWLAGVAACEMALNVGVPVLQPFGISYYRPDYFLDQDMRARMGSCKPMFQEITDEARVEFYKCWGIMPCMQEAMELATTEPAFMPCAPTLLRVFRNGQLASKSIRSRNSEGFWALPAGIDEAWGAVSAERVHLLF